MNASSAQSPLRCAMRPAGPDGSNPIETGLQPSSGFRSRLFYAPYGLLENPFGSTPDPRYLYESRTHAEARSSLVVGLKCGVGFQALIAPPGMGKTTILFDLLDQFSGVARTAFLFQPYGDYRDFLRCLMLELGESPDSELVRMQEILNQLLLSEHRQGRQTIIIVDEAQGLHTSVLESLRLLSNFETPTEKLLQIVLAGQPQLARKLAAPELMQLHQRICIVKTLAPLDLEETQSYIEHRLKIAGYQGQPLFTSATVRSIWEASHGVPREINTICFNALLLIAAVGAKQVDTDILREVIADLEPMELRNTFHRSPKDALAEQAPSNDLNTNTPRSPLLPSVPVKMDKPCEAFSPAHIQFYNFSRNPFGIAPDPSLLSLTSSHWAALTALYSGILQHQGVLLMTGDPGIGKSLVVASLMELLKSHHIQAKYVTGPKLCSSAAVTSAGGRLGSIAPCQTRDARAEFEPDFDQERGQQLGVLFVDEAQDPSINVLREVQLLVTPNNPQHRKMQIVIVGRPEVDQILNSHEFHQLRALIAIHHHLRPIQEAETEKYIACRVRAVQKDSESGPVFREDALAALCGHSRGNPRLLNFLCEAALIKGHAQRQRNITAAIIEEVAKQAPSDVSPQERIPYTNGKDATELLKAAGVMLDLHLALRRVRTEERHWMSRSTQPICS